MTQPDEHTTAVAQQEHPPSEESPGRRRAGAKKVSGQPASAEKVNRGRAVPRRSFFDIYKPGQGGYTRMGTAIGAGILIVAGADFLYDQMSVFRQEGKAWTLWLQAGVPLLAIVAFGLLTYWLVGVNRKACDFMIATEGEMKKVNWSTRKEVLGSTKVVIFFTLAMSLVLFIVDIVFMTFFSWIGVLREAPSILKALFGGGGG